MENYFQITEQGGKVLITVKNPPPEVKLPSYGKLTEFIRSKNYLDVDFAALKRAYKNPGRGPDKFARLPTGLGITSRFIIDISENGMTCYVTLLPPREKEALVYADAVFTEIKNKGVKSEAIEDNIKNALNDKIFKKKIVASLGTDPLPGKDGTIEPTDPVFSNLSGQISMFATKKTFDRFRLIRPIKVGEIAAKIHPPSAGISGSNVFGDAIPSIDGDRAVATGHNIEISGDKVLSKINGCIAITETGVDVEPLLLAKNIQNWNKKHEGSIVIMGDVDNCLLIEASGDIEIHGTAANSNLKAGRNIFVHGHIMTNHDNNIIAGGDILSENISNASIVADNLFVLSTILNSDVKALGTVQTLEKTGKIIGGRISSCSMVKTGAIGSEKSGDTKVSVATPKLIKQEREHLLDNLIIRIGLINKNKELMVLKLKTLKELMDKTLGSKFGGYNKIIELIKLEIEKCEGKISDLYKEIVKVKDPSHISTSGEVIADVYYPGTVISLGNSSRNINVPKHNTRFYIKESNVFSEEHKGI